MRAFMTCAILTVTTLTASATPAFAQPGHYADLVDGWYHRYLGRHVDSHGARDHVHALRHGTPVNVVEASILASHEYYARNGHTPEGYVAALYRDVVGHRANSFEFSRDVNYLLTHGRHATALRMLAHRHAHVVTRPVVVDPVVVVPAYRPAPVYVAPRPGFSLRIGIR